ncbi:MAG TPA: MlaE family lipid ABC transporter permease subunit [Polyangia bacterium]|jgi:phospholipid/cholesterol/gamma-HCH transport system permease protein
MTVPSDADVNLRDDETLVATGAWLLDRLAYLEQRLARVPWQAGAVRLDASGITALDTAGAWLLVRTVGRLPRAGSQPALVGLRPELGELLALLPQPAATTAPPAPPPRRALERVGRHALLLADELIAALRFVGETAATFARSFVQQRRVRGRAVLHGVETDGLRALPIIGLLSFLMGIVIAYQAAEQLQSLGASILIVDLVGVSVLREIAPLVVGIIVASRSGSSYTAQIGAMAVGEEVDALQALGLSPLEVLVIPRILALVVVVPLLVIVADIAGIAGGMLMARTQLGIGMPEFLHRLAREVPLRHYLVGLAKAPAFAGLIATVGCYHGLHTVGGASAVGRRTTWSVVQAVFLVIVADAAFSIGFSMSRL